MLNIDQCGGWWRGDGLSLLLIFWWQSSDNFLDDLVETLSLGRLLLRSLALPAGA